MTTTTVALLVVLAAVIIFCFILWDNVHDDMNKIENGLDEIKRIRELMEIDFERLFVLSKELNQLKAKMNGSRVPSDKENITRKNPYYMDYL